MLNKRREGTVTLVEAMRRMHLRAFAGLTLAEAAEVMGIGRRTAYRYWAFARAWLCDALSDNEAIA